jgi:glycosyltransferase involved in cell wall biosynthesis
MSSLRTHPDSGSVAREEVTASTTREPRRRTRVGVFSLYYPEYRDAVFARLSRDPDFEFTFLAGPPPEGSFIRGSAAPQYEHRSIRVVTVPIPRTRNVLSHRFGQLSALLRRRFDVLLLTNDVLAPDVWLCCLLSPLFRVPVCLWGQGLSRPPSRLRTALRYGLTSLAKAAVFYSEGGRAYWVKRGIAAKKLFVAYNALDTDRQLALRESLTPSVMAAFRAAHDLEGKKVVTYLGRLIAVKKPAVFIDAVARAAASEPALVGVVIGDGPQRADLERRAAERGVRHAVRFVGELYDERLMAQYLTASVAVVLPAAAGLAIQHAAVYGAPLVLGDQPGHHLPEQEIVVEGETGIWCPDDDVQAFADAILRLCRDPRFRDALSVNVRREIDEKYNVARMAQGFLDALRYCVDPSAVS